MIGSPQLETEHAAGAMVQRWDLVR